MSLFMLMFIHLSEIPLNKLVTFLLVFIAIDLIKNNYLIKIFIEKIRIKNIIRYLIIFKNYLDHFLLDLHLPSIYFKHYICVLKFL